MIDSRTKFYHTVAALPQEVASQILDLIQAPPAGDPYEVLRERLLTLYTLNNYQRFNALVSLPLSGDQKPSHLMNRMLALLPDDYKPDFILQGLFLRMITNQTLSSKVCFSDAFLKKSGRIFSARKYLILKPWPLKQTSFIRAKFLHLHSTCFQRTLRRTS